MYSYFLRRALYTRQANSCLSVLNIVIFLKNLLIFYTIIKINTIFKLSNFTVINETVLFLELWL